MVPPEGSEAYYTREIRRTTRAA